MNDADLHARWSPTSSSGSASPTKKPAEDAGPHPAKPSRLWLWFVLAFVVQVAAWAAWLVIASHNKVAEVPLVPTP